MAGSGWLGEAGLPEVATRAGATLGDPALASGCC